MIDSKQRLRINNTLLASLLLLSLQARADVASGGDYTLTKVLIGCSGVSEQSVADYDSAGALGEPVSGQSCADDNAIDTVTSGYFGGHAGNGKTFSLLSAWIDGTPYYQGGVRIGVPVSSPIHLTFSEPINFATLYDGVSVQLMTDHLGQNQTNLTAAIQFSADITGSTITLSPQSQWTGNTVYNVVASAGLQGIDGATLAAAPSLPFLTMLDPQLDNLVLTPVGGTAAAWNASAPPNAPPAPPLNIHVPPQAFSDYAVILVNGNPLQTSTTINPQIIQTANSKAQATYGAYATPLMMTQLSAINSQGALIPSLAQIGQISMSYTSNLGTNIPAYVRPDSLSLWALDSSHQMWVKMPGSQASQGVVTASISQFSLFALMGQAAGSASDVYAFPIPWRPHGPNAGTGVGQTGTEAAGITFTNLPSECTIKIYTLSGGSVREFHHSDAAAPIMGEETWDGHTTHGQTAASGVYLWRVESATDGKNGKLMIIR